MFKEKYLHIAHYITSACSIKLHHCLEWIISKDFSPFSFFGIFTCTVRLRSWQRFKIDLNSIHEFRFFIVLYPTKIPSPPPN